ncbi:16S rRNA (adenine(1518)-N(6)/adenine(1519)-N(6))-dimethyltransferase RsmA [Marinilactibacillus psychrotolerans]|uniref:Ribosomal RNA small subunit methyltransferase A n=2 Tax=Marinilactibacillus psychrotolerans TaxID=191770 RepID=A0AAV3WTD1_9LACT|nr:16S rRNA (adenine(1518)-N(6)/adenine(1519)-N(6))-dimethyltransferase RsmA [Marinilactibacillus psychrotolerans]SDC12757.1 16S rRNA (adenine1518-N6/adenine1519-N6)-dimethyltransferase [Marinilactibacillus psychrotolerans]SJN36358.1 SSU rRNA (adenine(1518)-N(6)/adenine(1519)-N(6))-dimethyltransferase [Marinilactibacillus psychrotolerans 42ea]GEL65960.1 ribosomal RNA small subunit methyltransferase A [Marinilactibacillus psychrotolerans]GEQ32465.1 dimethyladenosine transferase [Marinilactibacil
MSEYKDIATPARTKAILDKYRLSAKKSLGQNFIVDTNILEKIVATGSIDKETTVIEVGPGIGALTEQIAKKAKEVIAFEIDDRLLPVLEDTLSPYNNVKIIHQDILKVDMKDFEKEYLKEAERVVVIANLPYYVTTPIILNFLASSLPIDSMVLMMQKEVANRLSAIPSTKAYGSLSIAVQYYMDAEVAFIVPKTVFTPQPNVESAVIRLSRKAIPEVVVKDEKVFFQVTRSAFVQRRKTLWNNLQSAYGKEPDIKEKLQKALDTARIDPIRRGETLSLKEFGRLSDAIVTQNLEFQQQNK